VREGECVRAREGGREGREGEECALLSSSIYDRVARGLSSATIRSNRFWAYRARHI